ncbi:hypothetical protein [Demequina muriae]|uniref:Uncharacterized protein n=1 Tax=Demequina muriae TaxID=3051664 RepID=A0ABT8GEC4_9MICO|nr:hypothetical protein [Demequina sp. EGI L300058]MDN4479777.1 hypothetical protein [Demequina sp. EGI L300058]
MLHTRRALRRVIVFTALATVGSISLAACSTGSATDEPTSPPPTPTSRPSATSEPRTSPAATQQSFEHAFSGEIDYDQLADPGWESLDQSERDLRCDAFFAANIEDEIALDPRTDAAIVAEWFKNRIQVVNDLVKDTSEERSETAALNIADCLTGHYFSREANEKPQGNDYLKGDISIVAEYKEDPGANVEYIDPSRITRHGTGTFPAFNEDHQYPYAALSIEGYTSSESFPQLVVQYFQWVEHNNTFRLMIHDRLDISDSDPYFGEEVVVVDPVREGAPTAEPPFSGPFVLG